MNYESQYHSRGYKIQSCVLETEFCDSNNFSLL